jgi:hypothetical protein
MAAFQSEREAKEFLVSRIVEEAKCENVPLSDVERKMLYFSETNWTLPDIASVSEDFDRDYDQDEYEKKITRVIREAAMRDRQESPELYNRWRDAIRLLKKGDHYILVMIDGAGLHPYRGSRNSKEQPGEERSITSLVGSYLTYFIPLFVLCFLWLHFVGPRRLVGNWETHEPLSARSAALVSGLIALPLAFFILRRVG